MSEEKPTYWNGEPCKARKISAIVTDDVSFPLYWARREDLVGERIDLVEVEYSTETFYLDDRDGHGWYKVTRGRGSPRFGHREVTINHESIEFRY